MEKGLARELLGILGRLVLVIAVLGGAAYVFSLTGGKYEDRISCENQCGEVRDDD